MKFNMVKKYTTVTIDYNLDDALTKENIQENSLVRYDK